MGERTFGPIKEILLGMDHLLDEHSKINFNGISFSILISFFPLKSGSFQLWYTSLILIAYLFLSIQQYYVSRLCFEREALPAKFCKRAVPGFHFPLHSFPLVIYRDYPQTTLQDSVNANQEKQRYRHKNICIYLGGLSLP